MSHCWVFKELRKQPRKVKIFWGREEHVVRGNPTERGEEGGEGRGGALNLAAAPPTNHRAPSRSPDALKRNIAKCYVLLR